MEIFLFMLVSKCIKQLPIVYRITLTFGGDFNLALWQLSFRSPIKDNVHQLRSH